MREAPAKWLSLAGVLIIGGLLGAVSRAGAAESLLPCDGCELRLGVGGTYHFWGGTGGTVIPATLIFDHDRYELGVFRMATRQTAGQSDPDVSRSLAEPSGGVSASRRGKLIGKSRRPVCLGVGAAYKTQAVPRDAIHCNCS